MKRRNHETTAIVIIAALAGGLVCGYAKGAHGYPEGVPVQPYQMHEHAPHDHYSYCTESNADGIVALITTNDR